jgi:hypothetical protein
MPRRRRGARAVAIDADAERGLVMRALLYSPKDMVAGVLAFAAVTAIVTNALWLQAGRHPAPLFGTVVTLPPAAPASTSASPLPRPRPIEAEAAIPEPKQAEPRVVEPKAVESRVSESRAAESKAADPLANLLKATSAAPATSPVPRPPASIPVGGDAGIAFSSAGMRRVAAVQRALTEYGYGQLKPTGTVGSDTQAAIQKFERARRLPVTGQVSERLVRELTAMIGHPID